MKRIVYEHIDEMIFLAICMVIVAMNACKA